VKKYFKKPVLEFLENRLNPSGSGIWDQVFPPVGKTESITLVDSSLVDVVPREEFQGSKVVVIDGASDAIRQISEGLRSARDVSTVRIISHGAGGSIWFGKQKIDSACLSSRSGEIASWADSLAPCADLLLYGCSIAETSEGVAFVTRMARLTGADVAASDDITGDNGDLDLEVTTGKITHSIATRLSDWKLRGVSLPVEGDFSYSVENGAATVTGYSGPGGNIIVPSVLGGNPVRALGESLFRNLGSISGVVIPQGVKILGPRVFYGCVNLASVNLPAGLESIGDEVFQTCRSLSTVSIPSSVNSIGSNTFYDCPGLKAIEVESGNADFKSQNGVLYNRDVTRLIACPGGFDGTLTIPATVTELANYSFAYCHKLTELVISDSVQSVNYWVFRSCTALSRVTLPKNIVYLGSQAFQGCTALKEVIISPENQNYTVHEKLVYTRDMSVLVFCPAGLTGDISIPQSVSRLDVGAFQYCMGITGVTLSDNLGAIPDIAFYSCVNLEKIRLPETVKTIGYAAFHSCHKFQTFRVPAAVTAIGTNAFYDCQTLDGVSVDAGNQNYRDVNGVLYSGDGKVLIYFPNNRGGGLLIPEGVKVIESYAFNLCTKIESVSFPASLGNINNRAFWHSPNLKKIYAMGNAPVGSGELFTGMNPVLYYPVGAKDWTDPWNGLRTFAVGAPVIRGVTDDTGLAGDFETSDRTLFVKGAGVPGEKVRVFISNQSYRDTICDSQGNWSADFTDLELGWGVYDLNASWIDSSFIVLASSTVRTLKISEGNPGLTHPGKRIGSYVTYFAGNGSQFPNLNAFTALLPDGSLASWGAAGSGGSGAPNGTGFSRVFSNSTAFAAIKNDGTVVSWGDPTYGGSGAPAGSGFVEIASTLNSFTALRSDGSVAAWGDLGYYGSPFDPPPTDKDYVSLFSNRWSYAALKADGSINSWGYGGTGGGVGGRPAGAGYTNIFSNVNAFVAMGQDGSLHSWGDWMHGGTGAPLGNGYVLVVPCHLAFAALNKDGSVASWGRYAAGSDAPKDKGYVNLFASNSTFVAMKSDGSLTAWGDETIGVPAGSGFVHVSSTMSAFAALRDDGTIHCWGNAAFGGSGGPVGSGFIKVYSTGTAFAALNKDGSISAWGDPANGGTGAPAGNDFVKVLPNYGAFTAVRKDGSVVSWGNSGNGAAGYPSNIPVDHVQSVFKDSESIAKSAPLFFGASGSTFTVGVSGSFQALATGTPAPTFSLVAGTLPSGLTLATSGLLSGTPAHGTGGVYSFTIQAANGVSPDATQAFTLTVNQAPAITSSDHATFQAGASGTFSVIATGYPAPAFSITSGSLPAGVTLNSSGVLSGTPSNGTGGVYTFTIQATNGVSPNATQSFILTVNQAPAITSPGRAFFSEQSQGSFQILATGFPACVYSIAAGALPSGLVLDSTKGVISGIPVVGSAGTYTLTVRASNGVSPDANQTVNLTVTPLFANLVFNGDFELGNTGFSTDYKFSPGVIFDPQTYDVVTDPAKSRKDTQVPSFGDHTTGSGLMMALNGATANGPVVWKQTVGVTPNTGYLFSMWISSWWNTNLANLEVLFNGQTIGKPVAPSATGVWEQFRVDWNSGQSTSLTIEIVDRQLSYGGNDFAIDDISFGIPAVPELPDRDLILKPLDFHVGLSGQADLGVLGLPKPVVTLVSGGLPEGLKLTPGGQIIGKTNPGTGGLYKVPVRVSNGVGDSVQTMVGVRVFQAPDLAGSFADLIEGQEVSVQIHKGGYPLPEYLLVSGTLPEGLALSPSGILFGKLGFDTRGEYSFTVRASNGVGSPVVFPMNVKVGESPTKPGVFAVAASGGAEISTLVIYENGTGEKVREVDPFPGFKGEVFVDSGDVNDDGFEDIIVGTGNGSRNGHVVVFDGKRLLDPNSKAETSYSAGGSVRASLYAFVGYSSGVAVRMADINDDGFDDIIMAPGTSAGMVTQSHLRVWDGKEAMKDFEAGKPLPYDYRWELASFWAFGGTNAPGGGLSISVIRQDGPDLIVASQLFRGGSKVFRYDGSKVLTVEQDLTGNLYLWGSGNTVVGFLLEGRQFYATAGTGRTTPDTVYVRNEEGEVQYRIDRVFDGSPGGLRLGLANVDEDPEEELLVVRDYDSSTRAYDLFADKATLLETLLPGGVSGWV